MIRLIEVIALAMVLFFPIDGAFAGADERYAQKPSVKWENNRLSAEFVNTPVISLIADLLEFDEYKWQIKGDLPGNISMVVENFSVEESVRKIMRNYNLNYTMIQTGKEDCRSAGPHCIEQVTIYLANGTVRFKKTEDKNMDFVRLKRTENSPLNRRAAGSLNPTIQPGSYWSAASTTKKMRETASAAATPLPPKLAGDPPNAMPQEISSYLDQMMDENKISREVYESLKEANRKVEGLDSSE